MNYAYAQMTDGLDWERKMRVDGALLGKIGPNGGWIIDDPLMPASLRGQEAPEWYDPFEGYNVTAQGVAPSE